LNAFDDETHFEILRDTLQQIDLLYRVVDKYSNHMEIVHNASDIMRIFKEGKCASLIGVEGLHQIGNSSSVLRMYHKLGVRYITLAHNKNNPYADSAVSASRGLSEAG
jgi:membrane dipeptidase